MAVRIGVGLQLLLLTLIACQLVVLTESRKRKHESYRVRSSDSRNDRLSSEEDSGENDLGKWEKLVNMKNRLKMLKNRRDPNSRPWRESEEASRSNSRSEESGEYPRYRYRKGTSLFRRRPNVKVKVRRNWRRNDDRDSREKRDKVYNDSKSKEDGQTFTSSEDESDEELASEMGKLFLPKLGPDQVSKTYTSIKGGLKKRLKNIVPYCPDLHAITVLKDWGQMFKDSWPNFFDMGQKSYDYASDLRKQMGDCVKHYVSKQIIKGEGGKNWSNESRSDEDNDDKLPKNRELTRGADGKTRMSFKGKSDEDDDDDDSDEHGRKREVAVPKMDSDALATQFKTEFAEPVAEYFEKLPDMVAAINLGLP